jgi:hypothetical protein
MRPDPQDEFRRDLLRSLIPGRAFDDRPMPRVPGGFRTWACGATIYVALAQLLGGG